MQELLWALFQYFISPVLWLLQIVAIVYVVLGLLIGTGVVSQYNPTTRQIMMFCGSIIEPLCRPIRRDLAASGHDRPVALCADADHRLPAGLCDPAPDLARAGVSKACWRLVAGGAELRVRAQPGASKDAIEGQGEDAAGQAFLKVRVRAVPEKGKANAAIEQLLAKALGLPKSAVSVEKGETQRIKTVRISADPSIASGA